MAHEIGLNEQLGVVAVRYRGQVTTEEISDVMDEAVHLPGFREGLKAIGDFRDCDLSIGAKDIDRLVAYAKRLDLTWGDTRWALIADKDYIYGLARIYMAKTDEFHVETRVFHDNAEADDWLGIGSSLDDALASTLDDGGARNNRTG